MRNSPQTPDLFKAPKSGTPDLAVFANPVAGKSRRSTYKGGRRLASGQMFEDWLLLEGYSLRDAEKKLQAFARESSAKRKDGIIISFPDDYLKGYLQELVAGRYKATGWFLLLLSQALGVKLPWWTQYDGNAGE